MKPPTWINRQMCCPNCTGDAMQVRLTLQQRIVPDDYGVEMKSRVSCSLCGYFAVASAGLSNHELLRNAEWTQEDFQW